MIMMTKQWLNVCNFSEELVVSQQERFQSFSTGPYECFRASLNANTRKLTSMISYLNRWSLF